jgi:ubiquinone/menaquinone biosynthesis C-methylase UbiE
MHERDRRYRDLYNRIAPFYDWMQRFWGVLRGFSDTGERRKMANLLGMKPGQRVLEVSVGTGSNLPLVAEDVGPEGTMVGLDISLGMLRQCRRRFGARY